MVLAVGVAGLELLLLIEGHLHSALATGLASEPAMQCGMQRGETKRIYKDLSVAIRGIPGAI